MFVMEFLIYLKNPIYAYTLKKLLISNILIVIITISPFAVSGQELFNPETNLGINLGGNISRVNFDPSIDQDLNSGFQGGNYIQICQHKELRHTN